MSYLWWNNFVKVAKSPYFGKYLLVTNIVGCGTLMGVGDITLQTIERLRKPKPKQQSYDWKRTGRMCCMGLVMGPFNHYWYRFLDRTLPGRTGATIVKKILLDQTVASPFFAFTFFIGMGTLERQTLETSVNEFKSKFWTVYKADWSVWPMAQAVNFYFLPPQFRVLYVSLVTLCWNTFLSYMKHENHEEKIPQKVNPIEALPNPQ